NFKQTQLKDLHVQIEQNKNQAEEVTQEITESTEILSATESALHNLIYTKDAEEKKLNEADAAYYNHRNALQEKESALRHKIKSKEIIDQLLNEIKDRLSELKLNLAGMRERLHVEFKIDLGDILDEPRTSETTIE